MLSEKKQSILSIRNLNIWYGDQQILSALSFDVQQKQVTAFIGPANCGKSALVRCLNRLNDFTPSFRATGEIFFKGNLLDVSTDTVLLRKRIGMVFRKPILFQCSIYENVAYGVRISGVNELEHLDTLVEKNLRKIGLWNEVENILDETPEHLSE